MQSTNQFVVTSNSTISLFVKREDLLHPIISGNKFRKLKYNLVQAKKEGFNTLLTFGGAFSNHISAVAAAGKEYGFKTIGIIRGEELESKIVENPTLCLAHENGMRLEFVSREIYRNKEDVNYIELLESKFGKFYLLPEGGTNSLAIKGCEEILTNEDGDFDYICCAVATGGTIAGIIESAQENVQILGFPALKGAFLNDEISTFVKRDNWRLLAGFEVGGYGKVNAELINFMNDFYEKTSIPLDPVYTAKMIFGVMNLIDNGYFPDGSRILAIHTGGLQGIAGMNMKLKKANLPLIKFND